ncbi:hypothetical protein J7293_04664 [Nakaseomyces glabratus]|nr:hypothetical protein J7294_04673 [Nakaseomyces glabratus]KAH7600607.1 hypothetical protein J7293_05293 [Nakaseomyces glabratus]KAH7601226.1 hypothetical protein J7293_04664 [Nakaseomyces glabratus]
MPVWVFSGYRPKAKRQQSSRAEQQCNSAKCKVQQYILTKYNNSNQPPQIHTPPPIDNHTTVFPAKFYTHPISPKFFTFSTISRPPALPQYHLPAHPYHSHTTHVTTPSLVT